MRYGVITNDRMLAERVFAKLERDMGETKRRNSQSQMELTNSQGDCVRWVKPSENARGHKFDRVFIDIAIDKKTVSALILPMLIGHPGDEAIAWIASDRTTIYQYLIGLPQDRFESTLMVWLGVSPTESQKAIIHDWMNSPWYKWD